MKLVQRWSVSTSKGCLSKAWYTDSTGRRYMVKGNSKCRDKAKYNKDGDLYERVYKVYEPFSEVIAYKVAKCLGLACVEYQCLPRDYFPEVETFRCDYVSVCPELILNDGIQKLSAYEALKAYYGGEKNVKDYWLYYLHMPTDRQFLCSMLLFDAIIGNVDRHLNNWDGFWDTDAQGNMFYASLSLYDNGASLLAQVADNDLSLNFSIGRDISKPFKRTHTQQLQLIKRTFPDFKVDYNIPILWEKIRTEIQPELKLLPSKRAECVEKYLHNRLFYYLGAFNINN